MNAQYITQAHYLVKLGRFRELKSLYADYRKKHPELKDEHYNHTFRLLFTNSCMHGKLEISKWLYEELYNKLPEKKQMELQYIFGYCLMLSKKNLRFERLSKWLQMIISQLNDKFGEPKK